MAFLPILGALLGPAIGSIFSNNTATSAASAAAQSTYLNAQNIDEISSLASQTSLNKKNIAFNDKMMSNTEMAQESNLLQNFYVSVAQADKNVVEKLAQSVSQS